MKKIKYLAFLPMVIMMIVIWLFSSKTATESTQESSGIVTRVVAIMERVSGREWPDAAREHWEEMIHVPIRKCAHMTEYFLLSLTIAFPWLLFHKTKKWISIVTYITGVSYATSDEIHQYFVPNRSCQITDVMIDSIGVLAGILIFLLIRNRKVHAKSQ